MPEEDPPPPPVAAEAAEAPPPPIQPRRRPAAPAKGKSRMGMAIAWIILLLVVVGIAAGGWFGRNQIVAQFPQFEPVYTVLGIPVEPPGPSLELRLAEPQSTTRDGDRVVVLRGSVTNISDRKQRVPKLRARLTGQDGAVLLEWEFEAPKTELDAGGAVDFATEAVNPPREGQSLTINFVQETEEAS